MSLRTRQWAAAVASTAVAAALLSAVPPAEATSIGIGSASPGTIQPAVASTPFDCSPVFFQSAEQSNDVNVERLYTYDPVVNTFSQLGSSRTNNGKTQVLGYNTDDSYVYGLFNYQTSGDDTRMDLVRFNSAGTYTRLNSWKVPSQLNVGDFWKSPQGMRLVVGGDYMNDWRLVNVANTSDDTTQPSSEFAITGSGSSPYFKGKDIVIQGDVGYGLHLNTLYVLNLNDRKVTTKTVTFNPASDNHADGFGSAYADALGNLYFFENSSSEVWRIAAAQVSKASPVATMVGSGSAYVSSGVTLRKPNDGASCPNARSPYSAVISGETATSITDDTAALTASVRPFEADTTARICIGLSPQTSGGRLNGCQLTADATNADDTTPLDDTNVSTVLTPITVSNLSPRTTYYWQFMTTSPWAITYGAVTSFTTTARPIAITGSVTGIDDMAATLNATVNPGGQSTVASFCFGTAADLSGCTPVPAAPSPLNPSHSNTAVSAAVSGLVPGTTYYARAMATNADGDDSGTIVSFATPAVPLVSLGNATDVTSTDARLTGQVNPKGLSTVVTFCWGTQPSLATCDDSATASQSPLMPIDDSASVSVDLTGLTASTQYYMRVTASNANGSTSSGISTFTTAAAPLTLTTTTGALPGANVGEPYYKQLTAGGGQPPYTWTVASGTLPPGLTLITLDDTSGLISGTSTVAGATSFVVRVTDATSATATRTYSISTGAPPTAKTKAVTSVAGTTATLNGVVNPGNLLTAVDFCYGTAANLSGCSSINATQSPLAASTDDTVVSVTLSALQPGTTYYARVKATNSDDSSTGSIVSFTTTNKPSVTTGSATFLRGAGTTATLSGTVNPNGLSTSVDFCWGTTPTLDSCTSVPAGTLSASRSPSAVSIDDTRLSPNVTYYFTVQARNSLGTTIGSTATFTMPSASAVGPTITSVSPTSGPVAGGTSVTIRGTNFSTTGVGATVLFDDSAAQVIVDDSSTIRATSPAALYPGAVDVIVANPDGQAYRKVNAFTYTSAVRYAVTYVGNGWTSGTVPTDDTAYQYDDTVTVAAAGTMARSGYSFDGWNTAANGTGTAYAAGFQYRIHADDTLYAQWLPVAIEDLSDDTVNFGQQSITSGSSDRAVAVINAGAAAMTVTGISLTGDDSTDFDIDGGTCSDGSTVTGNSSCTIDLAFAPSQLGSRSAALKVETTEGTLTGALVGIGTTTYSVTYFGNGATSGSPPTDATAYSPGATVTVLGQGSLAWAGYEFAGWNTAAGGGGTPRAAGSTYAISGDDSLFAQWTPVGVPDLSPATLSFGSRQVSGGASAPQTATLTNSGAAALTITSVSVIGADASDFGSSGGTCSNGASIAPAASCTVGVTFDPTQSGARTATLQVVTSEGTVTSALTGSGTSPTPTPTAPPGAPRDVTATAGDSAAIVTWEAPASSGSFAITDYQVIASPGDAGCRATALDRQCLVTGLSNGVAYTFRVRALNGVGWGEYSIPSNGVTPQPGPSPSILITGSRDPEKPRRVRVSGSAPALIGQTVVPRFRFPGDSTYRSGGKRPRVKSDGTFTWQRRSQRRITVYFMAEGVRSNSVRIPSAPKPR